jgi:predicted dehydrogenase
MGVAAGVVGCGGISRFHFSGLEKAGAEILWVCDVVEEAARPWAERFGARYSADYRDVLADERVGLVDVTAVSSVHKEICLAAIDAGKAVVCEKTLAGTADDALEIVRAAEAKGTVLYTSYMKRFIPAVEKAKELLPTLGTVLSTHVRTYQPWGSVWEKAPEEGFFHTPPGGTSQVVRSYGGGILVCGGSHLLDLVLFFLGRPVRLCAELHVPEGRDYDLRASALIETRNGPVHYEALAHPLAGIGFLRDGWDERLEITGTRGRLEVLSSMWDEVERKSSVLVHYDDATATSTEHRFAPVSPFDRALAFFCGNVERGEQGSQSRLTGYEVDELIEAFKKSAAERRSVDVDWRA